MFSNKQIVLSKDYVVDLEMSIKNPLIYGLNQKGYLIPKNFELQHVICTGICTSTTYSLHAKCTMCACPLPGHASAKLCPLIVFCIQLSCSVPSYRVLCPVIVFCVQLSCSVSSYRVLCSVIVFSVQLSCSVFSYRVLCSVIVFCVQLSCSVFSYRVLCPVIVFCVQLLCSVSSYRVLCPVIVFCVQ